MKILFYYPTTRSDGYPDPPLGISYLMSIAKKMGFEYEFYDQDHHSKFFSLDKLLERFEPDVFVVSFMTPQYSEMLKVVKKFKNEFPDSKIIVGGSHVSSLPKQTLEKVEEIDFVCRGEGEKTFEEFLDYLEGKKKLSGINGLFYRKNGKIVENKPRKLMPKEELNDYSVDWDKILEHGPYLQKFHYQKSIAGSYPIITTRGCPFQCTFCDEGTIWKRKVRMRSVDNVIEEIKYLNKKFDAKNFWILDDTFTIIKSRVIEFCKKVNPLNIKFKITAKTTTVDEEMLLWLKKAGCKSIAYGVESGSNDVLRIMKKNQTVKDIKRAFKLTKKVGILSYALCMVGNIGEEAGDVKKTVELIEEIKPDLFSCTIMTPYPGSENYRICKDNNWIKNHNWEHWSPSVLKVKDFEVVSRTDKMDYEKILKMYYFMNRSVLINRFKSNYGDYFPLNPVFYYRELFPRLRSLGPKSFLEHGFNILRSGIQKIRKSK